MRLSYLLRFRPVHLLNIQPAQTRQALKFLPVVKAAGGSFETAIDHLLATRIFRSGKVTGRYDTEKANLEAIEDALIKTLNKVFPNIVPVRCQTAIEKDIRRLEKAG